MGDVLRMHRRDRERRLSHEPPSSIGAEPPPPLITDHVSEGDPVNVFHHRERHSIWSLGGDWGGRARAPLDRRSAPGWVGVGLRSQLPEDGGLAPEPAQRLLGHPVGTKHLDDDRDAIRLVVIPLVNPPLAPFADQLAKVIPTPSEPSRRDRSDGRGAGPREGPRDAWPRG